MQDLASIVGSPNRQAASQHLEDFRQCGEDFRAFVLRKRKVDATVVEAVLAELLHTPLAGPTELVSRVQTRLDRHDLSVANIESALEQISCVPVLRVRRRRDEDPWPEGPDAAAAEFPSTEPAPDRLVLSAEVKQRLSVAMSRMSAQEKAAFVLRHFEGMSIAEIGEALELEASATKQSVLRAVRKVRQVLAPAMGLAQ